VAEIEAWASRERERRRQWLSGPTPEQAAVAIIGERDRQQPEHIDASEPWSSDIEARQLVRRLLRTTQLVVEGSVSLLLHLSLEDVRKRLVQAGLEWEEQSFEEPTQRR
jgi:hypothetical protein